MLYDLNMFQPVSRSLSEKPIEKLKSANNTSTNLLAKKSLVTANEKNMRPAIARPGLWNTHEPTNIRIATHKSRMLMISEVSISAGMLLINSFSHILPAITANGNRTNTLRRVRLSLNPRGIRFWNSKDR